MNRTSSHKVPGLWHGMVWAFQHGGQGGGISRLRLVWRTLSAILLHGKAMRRWMSIVFELSSRKVIDDLPAAYLRAVRPYVHRGTDISTRVVQLIDHVDWVETAFKPAAFSQLASGRPLILADLVAPRGYEYMRLQLQRAAPQSPEGELLLTLTLLRTADVQQSPQPVDAAALGFSRFRVDDLPCLVIGGVRGQRHPVLRLSPVELSQALCGWKPAVLMVRVAQELARTWGLHLVGLDPSSHRLQGWGYQWNARYRDAALRIYNSYDALWEHFKAKKGPPGWMIIPQNSDEKLEATALSPEKRARQTRRADYWIRIRNLLRLEFRELLQRPDRELRRNTQSMAPDTVAADTMAPAGDDFDFSDSDAGSELPPLRVLESGPGSLI
jgi:uncharacterized protein VirK/YbjX